jgi:hypothetical protein
MKKSLAMKLDELCRIGKFTQLSFQEAIDSYNDYPEPFKTECINEASRCNDLGLIYNKFETLDSETRDFETILQWATPSQFVKNCYEWIINI